MRISSSEYYRTMIVDNFQLQYDIWGVNHNISTGKQINVPSDAPDTAITVLTSLQSMREVEQYRANLNAGQDWIKASEQSMNSINDLITRAKVLAEKMSTGTQSKADQASTATEVRNILEQIITLANTRVNGSYIFGGNHTESAAVNAFLADTGHGPGHATLADLYYQQSSGYHLRFSRDDAGLDSTFLTSASNTLGASLGLDFSTWTTLSEATDSPATGQTTYCAAFVSSIHQAISMQVGEELTWMGDSEAGAYPNRSNWLVNFTGSCTVSVDGDNYAVTDAQDLVNQVNAAAGTGYTAWLDGNGAAHVEPKHAGSFSVAEVGATGNVAITRDTTAGGQTFRTSATIRVSDPGRVTIGGDVYPPPPAAATDTFSDASELINLINSDQTRDYFAYLEGSDVVHIVSKDEGGAFAISGASGGVTVDQTTTMQELLKDINQGLHANGVINLKSWPADTDTVTINGHRWSWDQILGDRQPTSLDDYAEYLADYISDNTDDYSAQAVLSGGTVSVQIAARTAGKAGNVNLEATGAGASTSGGLFGGLDPTELNPITTHPMASNRALLSTDSADGHDTEAEALIIGAAYYLQFARGEACADAVFSLNAAASNLGQSLGLDFSDFSVRQNAQGSPPLGQIVYFPTGGVTALTDSISSALGEELSWTADADTGQQTYRTHGTIDVTGAGNVQIGADLYAAGSFTDAAGLVDLINSDGTREYYAYQVGQNQVRVMAKGTPTAPIAIGGATGGVSLADNETTLQELIDAVNNGVKAVGSLHIDNTEGVISVGAPPLGTETVRINGDVYAAGSFSNASELVDLINADDTRPYYAYLDGAGQVRVVSETTASITIDNAGGTVGIVQQPAVGGLPDSDDTVTLGDNTWTWGQITGDMNLNTAGASLRGADEYAQALAEFVNTQSTGFSAITSASGDGATVQITANAAGSSGNAAFTASTAGVETSGALFGGLDGTQTNTTGRIYGSGHSDLRLSTEIQATVTEVDGDDVTLMLSWYGDYGKLHEQEVVLAGEGEDYAIEVEGMGGLSLFRDGLTFEPGAVFTLKVGHHGSYEQDTSVNFSRNTEMDISWNSREVLGESMGVDLLGEQARPRDNTGDGKVYLAGLYQGLTPRDLLFQVVEEGQAPDDSVTMRVSWTDDNGLSRFEDIVLDGTGKENQVEVPGCNGVSVYIDGGAFNLDDSFHHSIEKDPKHLIDTLAQWEYQLRYGSVEEAQEQSQLTLDALNKAAAQLLDQIGEAGTRQDRITVREKVLDDQDLYNAGNLEEMQEVNLYQAYMQLNAMQTAYNNSLKVTSQVMQLSLVNYF